jgi:hypothetical protein
MRGKKSKVLLLKSSFGQHLLVLSELSNILEDVRGWPSAYYYYSWEQYKLKCSSVNDNLQVSYHHVDF